jgi:predicted Rossmann fold flavoprotein
VNDPIVIIGAGPAGLMSAIFAAGGPCRVVVLERTPDGGRKILISGGGRCNVLPSVLEPERFVTDSAPHVMRGLLRSWPLPHQKAFFEHDLRIPLALEGETGKLFPVSNRARDVRDALVDAARIRGVSLRFDVALTGIEPNQTGWVVHTNRGPVTASRLVLATGGLSVPSSGSEGTGLRLAESLGHRVHRVYPALTPLTATPPVHAALSGLSLRVRLRARCGRRVTESTGGFLFTHRGYSGPAVLDISHVAVRSREAAQPATLRVQWATLDAVEWESMLASTSSLVATAVSAHLPQRLATQLMAEAGVPVDRRASELRRAERTGLIACLTSYPLPWSGDEGFKKAEVTGGGVALDEVNPHTLESRRHPGLFFCGEMLDAFGPIGGHNFAWAWATGRLAGLGVAGSAENNREL